MQRPSLTLRVVKRRSRNEQNLPLLPIGWNIRAPALPSVLEIEYRYNKSKVI